ncbi:MAG TPA: NrfD/PsrC family molybdoenzyme membrane anchor subunit [Roseiflexaceae bacterium]|nr:NrfD/PsrC family molybdoenzyme membrane anchor subunit [Roseiflexaceae bacterium]
MASEHLKGSDGASAPILEPGQTFRSVSEKISSLVLERKTGLGWFAGLGITFLGFMMMMFAISYLLYWGVGVWGVDIPVAWGFAIVNFVWWIGIGHAGTLISAILYLMRQEWRTSINRFAEAMTLFAVVNAGLFPILHLGRQWLFYYLIPYPNTMTLWPQFRSPLVWDFFAVSTYLIVSLLFWYIGVVPDMATLRDRAQSRLGQVTFGILSLGWRNSARHWKRFQSVYLLLAALATPLVVSVHTIVSWDFAVGIVPGWHSTIFPPYFVAGALFQGFAMVLILTVPLRRFYHLEAYVTERHLDFMAQMTLVTGLIVTYGYVCENFTGWYSGNIYERYLVINRALGPYGWVYWLTLACNVVAPQILWFKWARRNTLILFLIGIIVSIGMWIERFTIVVTSLHRDFVPAAWGMFYPTIWDYATFFGTVGFFFMLFLLFVRLFPVVPMFEVRELITTLEKKGEYNKGSEASPSGVVSEGAQSA